MGLPEDKCRKALKKCDLNVAVATEWLFAHMDDPDSEEDEQINGDDAASDLHAAYQCSLPGIYEL